MNRMTLAVTEQKRWFAALGCPTLAYVRAAEDGSGWEVHGADGALLGLFQTRSIALTAARRRDYDAVSVH